MSETAALQAAEPDGAPRIAVLDILRGIAILGILFMNINDMGGALWVMFGDPRQLGWSMIDQVAWVIREVPANGTARCMLEMLFGAGMVILTDRAALAAGKWVVLKRYYARNLILLGFGLVHIFILLWPGDILHTYAIAALIAVFFRRWRPRWLIAVGLILAVSQFGGAGYFGYYQTLRDNAAIARVEAKRAAGETPTKVETAAVAKATKARAGRVKEKAKQQAKVAEENKARTGTFMTWAAFQWSATWYFESHGFELLFVWEALSTMLIGAALFKLGILQGARTRAFYIRLTLAAYAVGFGLRVVGVVETMHFDPELPQTIWATSEFARLAMTLGHVGAVNWLVGTVLGAKLLRPFVAAGRTALSIYICQTLITLWVLFPPFGLRLYGTMSWAPLMLTALVIDVGLLWAANVYVRHFDIAPVEWAWRSLVEGRRLPWRKVKPGIAVGGLSAA